MRSILQPVVPHYRDAFFKGLQEEAVLNIYCYEHSIEEIKVSKAQVKKIKSFSLGPFLVYNPFALLDSDTKILILMLHIGHVTTWFLLITKFIHRRKIVLWGHGISVKRYIKESHKPSTLIKWQIQLADHLWLYTKKEKEIWNSRGINFEKVTALNNTITRIEDVVSFESADLKNDLKKRYQVKETKICIFSARFTLKERRADILEYIIQSCEDIGFVIIGDGPLKPDFSSYANVYDMGAIYDTKIKNELFSIADVYVQPAWLGLSVVEAMAYGLPVYTLKRTEEIKQCVEYYYLEESGAGKIFESADFLIRDLQQVRTGELITLGTLAKQFVKDHLMMKNMVDNALESLKSLES